MHALDPGRSLWSIRDVASRGLTTDSRRGLVVTLPGERAVAVSPGRYEVDLFIASNKMA